MDAAFDFLSVKKVILVTLLVSAASWLCCGPDLPQSSEPQLRRRRGPCGLRLARRRQWAPTLFLVTLRNRCAGGHGNGRALTSASDLIYQAPNAAASSFCTDAPVDNDAVPQRRGRGVTWQGPRNDRGE